MFWVVPLVHVPLAIGPLFVVWGLVMWAVGFVVGVWVRLPDRGTTRRERALVVWPGDEGYNDDDIAEDWGKDRW